MKKLLLGLLIITSVNAFSSEEQAEREFVNFPANCASLVPFGTAFCSAKATCEKQLERRLDKPIANIKITSFEAHTIGSGWDGEYSVFMKEYYCYMEYEK